MSTATPGKSRPAEPYLDAGVDSDARLQKPDRVFVVAVEQVLDAPEEREARSQVVRDREIHRRVARGIQALNREVAVAVHPGSDPQKVHIEKPSAGRLPGSVQVALVLGPAQQLLVL